MGKRKRRSYTSEYKAEVVKLIRQSDKSIGAVARDLDLTETAFAAGCSRLKSTWEEGQRER